MIIVKTDTTEIYADTIALKKAEPILWCRQGMFCLIPTQIVQNALDISEINKKLLTKSLPRLISFTWDQGIPVDSKIGYALMGE